MFGINIPNVVSFSLIDGAWQMAAAITVGLVATGMLYCRRTNRLKRSPPSPAILAGTERIVDLGNGIELVLCWIPQGTYVMGSLTGELGKAPNEGPVCVDISRGFWLAKTPCTQAQWGQGGGGDVSDRDPVYFHGSCKFTWQNQYDNEGTSRDHFIGANLPVERIDWPEARLWCHQLTQKLVAAGKLEKGWYFDLPTEAQWEYACRAGQQSSLNDGTQVTAREGVCQNLDNVGWYRENSLGRIRDVGQKEPNSWGLQDMHGNVLEWCRDCYRASLPGGTDPWFSNVTTGRVVRGGAWLMPPWKCRSAYRIGLSLTCRCNYLGFRPGLFQK